MDVRIGRGRHGISHYAGSIYGARNRLAVRVPCLPGHTSGVPESVCGLDGIMEMCKSLIGLEQILCSLHFQQLREVLLFLNDSKTLNYIYGIYVFDNQIKYMYPACFQIEENFLFWKI